MPGAFCLNPVAGEMMILNFLQLTKLFADAFNYYLRDSG